LSGHDIDRRWGSRDAGGKAADADAYDAAEIVAGRGRERYGLTRTAVHHGEGSWRYGEYEVRP
jgi:hypothetical protein